LTVEVDRIVMHAEPLRLYHSASTGRGQTNRHLVRSGCLQYLGDHPCDESALRIVGIVNQHAITRSQRVPFEP
jgi:hypothetical protein